MFEKPPEWLQEWGRQVDAKLEDGLREGPLGRNGRLDRTQEAGFESP